MMISTSFIVINPSSVINDHNEDAYTCQSAALNLDGGSPLCAITASLISDTANCLETQPVEFHCRVITVLMQILVGLLNNLLLWSCWKEKTCNFLNNFHSLSTCEFVSSTHFFELLLEMLLTISCLALNILWNLNLSKRGHILKRWINHPKFCIAHSNFQLNELNKNLFFVFLLILI